MTLRVICVRLGLCACVCVYLCTHTQPLPPGFKKKSVKTIDALTRAHRHRVGWGRSQHTCVSRSWPAPLSDAGSRGYFFAKSVFICGDKIKIPPSRLPPPSWSEKPKQPRWRRNPFGTNEPALGAGAAAWPAFRRIDPRRAQPAPHLHSNPLRTALAPAQLRRPPGNEILGARENFSRG